MVLPSPPFPPPRGGRVRVGVTVPCFHFAHSLAPEIKAKLPALIYSLPHLKRYTSYLILLNRQ
jgi:hypothetical protein